VKDPAADISSLASQLGPEGQSVYRLLINRHPDDTPELISLLPGETISTIDALTLADKELRALRARLILVHGKTDPLIPYTESVALSRAVAPAQARLFIIHHALAHVDLRFSQVLTARFWTQELPDAVRVLRAVAMLLREREPGSSSAPSTQTQPQ
jgi:hypothetical protein